MWETTFYVCVAIVAIAVSVFIRAREKEGPCQDDPSLSILGKEVLPCDCFSETYEEAREKFRSLAKEIAGVELHTLEIFKNYTTDIAILRGDLDGLVLHVSGVSSVITTIVSNTLHTQQALTTIHSFHRCMVLKVMLAVPFKLHG